MVQLGYKSDIWCIFMVFNNFQNVAKSADFWPKNGIFYDFRTFRLKNICSPKNNRSLISPGSHGQGGGVLKLMEGGVIPTYTKFTLIVYILWNTEVIRVPDRPSLVFLTLFRGYQTANIEICIKRYGEAKIRHKNKKSLNPWF